MQQTALSIVVVVFFVPWIHFEACVRQVAIDFPHRSLVEIGWNKMSRSLLLKLNFSFFLFFLLFFTFTCAPHPAESSLIFITIQMEKSYNVPRLTMHRRLVNFIYLGSICSFGRTENTTKAKLAIIQTNKNMEPKEQALHRCNFFWDSYSLKEKAEKVSFDTLWVINSHVCSRNVCHKRKRLPTSSMRCECCITAMHYQVSTQTLHSNSYYGMYENSCDYFKAPPWLEPGTSCIICPGRQ